MFISGPLPGDASVQQWLHHRATPLLDNFFIFFTDLGGAVAILIATLALVLLLANRHRKLEAAILATGVFGAAIINIALKLLFERVRPTLWQPLVIEHSFSFPSGHAMASSALVCCVVILMWRNRWRWWILAGASAYMVLIGISRVYLGVHYPSDVLAGWLISVAWVFLARWIVLRLYRNR
jgi:membrane-associated phospholipid phosphatase